MSTLNEIQTKYQLLLDIPQESADVITVLFDFEQTLLSDESPDVVSAHYMWMTEVPIRRIHQALRATFAKRKNVEQFLIEKLKVEKREQARADIIQILGKQRSPRAYAIAIDEAESASPIVRKVCLFVIGWVGSQNDIDLLANHLQTELEAGLRITAGSAMRQIAWRIPGSKPAVLSALKAAFFKEPKQAVRAQIIVLLGTIAVKNLGLRESNDDPDILLGDYDKAVAKATRFLQSIP